MPYGRFLDDLDGRSIVEDGSAHKDHVSMSVEEDLHLL